MQNDIRSVITDDGADKDALIDDIVDAACRINASPTWINILTIGVVPYRNHRKRKKLRKVVETILTKIFDVTLGWYDMDYEDVKMVCDHVGGMNYFGKQDHRAMYVAVIQRLEMGPIRDKCTRLGIIKFVQVKIIDIRNNYLEFKTREL